ncbi:hypothetical protein CRE_29669 [Caenorhabditis remanei]|uniref:Sdz-33 F-box domain-containing protein n=1 Tax=Caenorhabditis remanei TaxID=31234 RepID=E3LV41_CAERE|nr:hypothetical protein CRE_29669 [Caenorhabditis remanei]
MLSLCSKVSQSKCKLMKPAKPLRLKVHIGIGVKLTVSFENPRPETESVKKNPEWKPLYVDDFVNPYPFTIAHEFSYLTSGGWLSNNYNSKTDRTTSKYWISKVFHWEIHEKVMKWIDTRRSSIDKLSVHCCEPLKSLQNILKYSKPKKEFNIKCEVFNPGWWVSEDTKNTHVVSSMHFNSLLKLNCPIIDSKCTAFTDEELNFFLKNWKKGYINVEFLSVAQTSSSSDIDEKTVIEELDVVKLDRALFMKPRGEIVLFRGYSIQNDQGKKALFEFKK